MDRILKDIKPKVVFEYFEALTRIPRESGNENEVAAYLEEFGKSLGLETKRDTVNNVIISKPGTPGYETAPHVILQGHTDMVCVKKDDLTFDFNKDPIPIYVDGDFIRTKGTTLGADNGIAVAMAMSILASNDLSHPPITALFTTAEETGMDGVMGLEKGSVAGDILINLDSEEEGVLLASCAGGVNNITELPIEFSKENPYDAAFKVVIQGLAGGHSGIEIHKNRANAIKLLGRTLSIMRGHFPFALFEVAGGEKMNAIAKRSEFKFALPGSEVMLMESLLPSIESTFKSEFEVSDPGFQIIFEEIEVPEKVFTQKTTLAVETLLRLTPFGVQTMSAGMPGLVESSNNLGVLEQVDGTIRLTNAIRSSVKSLKQALNEEMTLLSEWIGAKNYQVADYPEWPFKVESPTRDLMKKVYQDLFDKELKVDAIHAGLECGFLKEKIGDIDMVSLGPDLFDVHTPNEHISISSTERVYNFVCDVLKHIK
jgi:dipeptidase D